MTTERDEENRIAMNMQAYIHCQALGCQENSVIVVFGIYPRDVVADPREGVEIIPHGLLGCGWFKDGKCKRNDDGKPSDCVFSRVGYFKDSL